MSGETTSNPLVLKKDKFFRNRENCAEWWKISCSQCRQGVLLYQKDGHGKLFRCYLNRIFAPIKYTELQNDKTLTLKKIPKLVCSNCKTLLGIPMLHWEGRLAFRLIRGSWTKQKLVNEAIKKFKESVERESS